MKLIDADNFSNEFNTKIFNKLQNEYLNSTADDKTKDIADFVTTDIMIVFNTLIENTPTVDTDEIYKQGYHAGFCATHGEPERLRGKWIDTGSGQECSICKEIQYGYDSFRHFCPNCGVYMEDDQK